ncbi:MAG: cytochrome-c peroxidase [Planctomycetota bacterium]
MRFVALLAFSASLAAQGPGGGGGGPPPALPPVPVPAQNPITPAKAVLGKLLFWEEQLSSNNRVACGTCHRFEAGGGDLRRNLNPGVDGVQNTPDDIFASPGLRRSDDDNHYIPDPRFGFNNQVTDRQSQSFVTAAWFTDLFWDGRADTTFVDPDTGSVLIPQGGGLESQAVGPVLSSVEMAHDVRLWSQVTSKLATARPMVLASNLPADMAAAIANDATYPDLFLAAFGTPDITAARIGLALATYQRTLVPDQSPYDQFAAGNPAAMTQQQHQGFMVFTGPGRCVICHSGGLTADDQFHNLGLRPIAEDNGRQSVTNAPADAGRFKTPSLRNVGLRNSFMHNGQFTTLAQVVGFYNGGGGPFPQNKDPQLIPLGLSPQQQANLVAFVSTALTDPRVAQGLPPFDRPTLYSETTPSQGQQAGAPTAGSGNQFPLMLAGVPANLGNPEFKLGMFNGLGGAPVTLVVSTGLAFASVNGINVNVDLNGSELLIPGVLGGTAGVVGDGYGTLAVGLPNAPFLAGLSLYAQWFVWDAGAPNGAASTRSARLQLF